MYYYQFHITDYKSHTDHLDPLEDIAYRRMLDWCYLHEKPLPKEIKDIARLIKMRPNIECITSVLREFFFKDEDGNYCNKRVLMGIGKYHEKSAKARESVKARWDKAKGDTNVLRTHNECNTNQEPITNNQEPITKNHKPPTKDQNKGGGFVLPVEVSESVWQEFEQHRKEIRKPLKDLSRVKSANILKTMPHDEQQACVDKSISSGWAGLFPDKTSRKSVEDKNKEVFENWLNKDKTIEGEFTHVG